MLKNISPLISPDLLKILAEMGHGDEIVIVDAYYPAHSMGVPVIRADGILVSEILNAIIPIFALDTYSPPLHMMSAEPGDSLDPNVEERFKSALTEEGYCPEINYINRLSFYERAKKSYAIIITGERAKYGCIILKKGGIE
ncbi:L-fucose mutarotase [Enterobacter hormaechei]|uniref:L-fucose mutarotase n=1 Tax=Enterobacter hormaechei TaxID=158836 RepID=UPI003CF0D221